MAEIQLNQQANPVLLLEEQRACWWLYKDKFYRHNEPIDDVLVVKGLIIQNERRRMARLEKARKVGQEEGPRS
jgi:hypothetical protein